MVKKLTIEDLAKEAQARNTEKQQTKDRFSDLSSLVASSDAVQMAIIQTTRVLLAFLKEETLETEVKNFPAPVTSVETPDVAKVVEAVKDLANRVEAKETDFTAVVDVLEEVKAVADKLPKEFPKPIEPLKSIEINNLKTLIEEIQKVTKAVDKQKLDPKITVKPAKVDIDLKPLEKKLEKLLEKNFSPTVTIPNFPETDLQPLVDAVKDVQSAVETQQFPVPNFTAAFKDSDGAPTSATLVDGKIPVEGLVPVSDYNSQEFVNTNTDEDTITYKQGVTTVKTMVITYQPGADKLSDTFDTIEYT